MCLESGGGGGGFLFFFGGEQEGAGGVGPFGSGCVRGCVCVVGRLFFLPVRMRVCVCVRGGGLPFLCPLSLPLSSSLNPSVVVVALLIGLKA